MASASRNKDSYLISQEQFEKARAALSSRIDSIPLIFKEIYGKVQRGHGSFGMLIEEAARHYPDRIAIKSDQRWLSFREFNESVNRYANYFIDQGLKRGESAVIIMENRPELFMIFGALAKLGVSNSMINTNVRHDSLMHCIELIPSRISIIGEELIDHFMAVKENLLVWSEKIDFFVSDKGKKTPPNGFTALSQAVEKYPTTNPRTASSILPRDILCYIFTSGTTGGMPKAAEIPHIRTITTGYMMGKMVLDTNSDDTIFCPLPFYHSNALMLSWPISLVTGAALAFNRKFSATNFWNEVAKYNATLFCYIGELCRYLINQPPKEGDNKNTVIKVFGNGMRPEIWKTFKERFAIPYVYEFYGASESHCFFVNIFNFDNTVGICLTPHAIVKYDVDEDRPIVDDKRVMQIVETGETGLLLGKIRDVTEFKAYSNEEETEKKILRDVFEEGDAWFNTGDLLRDIGCGHAQFVDRLGETFRWKGENVSTTEVEMVCNCFPQVSLSAVYGVTIPGFDGRAGMAALLPTIPQKPIDLAALADHFYTELPFYAVPRFIRIRSDFDMTSTYKIKKQQLKSEGFDPHLIGDPLYVLRPDDAEYRLLTPDTFQEIMAGKHKF